MSRSIAVAALTALLACDPPAAVAWIAVSNGDAPASDRATAAAVDAAGAVFTFGVVNDAGGGGLLTVVKADDAGRELWRRAFGGTVAISGDGSADASAMAVDGIGDVVLAASVPNVGTDRDVAVVKLAGATGAEVWRVVVDGAAHWGDAASAVAIDAAGDVLVLGSIVDSGRQSDVLVLKLAGTTGQELWRTILAGAAGNSEEAADIAVGPSGQVAVAASLDNAGANRDFTVALLDGASGAAIWGPVELGDGNADRARSVAVAAGGDLVVAGTLRGPGGTQDLAVVRLAVADGHEVWRRLLNFGQGDDGRLVALDAAGDVVAAGTMTTGSAGRDVVVAKLAHATGGILWVRTLGGDAGEDDDVSGLALDGVGNVVVGGATRNTGTAGDFTVARWSSDGAAAWTRRLLGPEPFERAHTVATTAVGDVFAVGAVRAGPDDPDLAMAMLEAASGASRWERTIAGTGNDSPDEGQAVAVDAVGHVVAAGITRPAGGAGDFTVTAHDGATGALRWERRLAGTLDGGINRALAVALDDAGDVVAGGVLENVDTHRDLAVVKLAGEDGAERWRITLSDSDDEITDEAARAVAVDAGGDVVAAGRSFSGLGNAHFVVTRREGGTGAERWTRMVEDGAASSGAGAEAVAVDAAGDVVAAGLLAMGAPSGSDFAVVKLARDDGAERWRALVDGAAGTDTATSVVVDGGGDVVAAGWVSVPSAGHALFVVKLGGGDGAERWRYLLEPDDPAGSAEAFAVAVDPAGDVVVAGGLEPVADVHRFLVLKLSGATGAELWRRATGPEMPFARSEAHAIAVDGAGDVLAVGRLELARRLHVGLLWKLAGATGAERWSRTLAGSANGTADLRAVALDAGGSVAVAGDLENAGTALDLAVAKVAGTTGSDAFCGDGIRSEGERCDDGNSRGGDCCSITCEPAEVAGVCGAPCATAPECEDADPCTTGVCDATSHCVAEPVTGDAAVTCAFARSLGGPACTTVPRRMNRLYARAGRLVMRAVGTERAAPRRRLYRGASAALGRLERAVDRAERARRPARRLSAGCAAALRALLADARSRVDGVRG